MTNPYVSICFSCGASTKIINSRYHEIQHPMCNLVTKIRRRSCKDKCGASRITTYEIPVDLFMNLLRAQQRLRNMISKT